jgi:hypothetical protein
MTAAAAEERPGRRRARKDRQGWCKPARGPHVYKIVLGSWRTPAETGACRWTRIWDPDTRLLRPRWACDHVSACEGCGRIERRNLAREECPRWPEVAGQLAGRERKAAEATPEFLAWWGRRARDGQPMPPVDGPQGYRRKRAAS